MRPWAGSFGPHLLLGELDERSEVILRVLYRCDQYSLAQIMDGGLGCVVPVPRLLRLLETCIDVVNFPAARGGSYPLFAAIGIQTYFQIYNPKTNIAAPNLK